MTTLLDVAALLWILLSSLVTFAAIGFAGVYIWERYTRGNDILRKGGGL